MIHLSPSPTTISKIESEMEKERERERIRGICRELVYILQGRDVQVLTEKEILSRFFYFRFSLVADALKFVVVVVTYFVVFF